MEQPQQLGKYKFEQFLGGGMSHVYKARDTLINRVVVVKLLTDSGMHDEDTKKRFLREAQMAGSISHENIIRVYDFGEIEGRPYMVMEYLQGSDVRHAINQGQIMSVLEKLKILVQLARAMEHIQNLGIIHRDLKPDNVFLSETGIVKLMDFGIAKTKDLSITRTGYTLGTPYYMSPEQVTSKDVNAKADIYAYGIVMYELFTGSKPFQAQNVHEVFFKILNEPLDPAPLVELKIPTPIVELVKKCTAKDQNERPPDFGVIVKELENVIRTLETADEDTITKLSKPKFEITKPMWIGGAVAVGVLVLLILWSIIPKPGVENVQKKTEEPKKTEVVELPISIKTATGDMVLVRAGEFLFGEDNQKRMLKDFYIDKHEVTNELFKKFATEKNWPLPPSFPDDEESKNLPVVNVTFDDAREFAQWAGKRIPTAMEWEKAARGPQGRTYPWGFDHLPDFAIVNNNNSLKGLQGPKPVGSWRESTSLYEAMDLAGNVHEWVDERVKPSAGAVTAMSKAMKPPPTADEVWMQFRGGSFFVPLIQNVSVQYGSAPVRFRTPDLGFRCAIDAGVKPK